MKNILKKIYGNVIHVPVLGYLLQIMVAIAKLPLTKNRTAIIIDGKAVEISNKVCEVDIKLAQLAAKIDHHEATLEKIEIDLPAIINMLDSANSVIRLYKRELTDLQKKLDQVSNLHNVN